MKFLAKYKCLKLPVLDYGSGKGFDAMYYQTAMYDPNHFPFKPRGKFRTITCNFVLNVVRKSQEKRILKDIQDLLANNGSAYISVRRDIKGQHIRKNGTYQRRCELPYLCLMEENSDFAIYHMRKDCKI